MADFSSLEMLPVASVLAFAGDLTLKIFALILLAAIAALLLRKSTAATRHMVWLSALVATLLLPAASYFMPAKLTTYWKAPAFATATPAAAMGGVIGAETRPPKTYAPDVGSVIDGAANLPASESKPAAQSAASRPFPWVALIAGVYATGTFAILLQILLGIVGVARLSRASAAVTTTSAAASILADLQQQLGIRRKISLRIHEDAIPMTWGWRRPVIMLPPDGENWETERLRVVLLHELAHIARSDWPTQMLAHLICAAHWPNPLIWWAAARMRAESERACDDRVLLAGVSSDVYARHLLEIARRCSGFNGADARFAAPMACKAPLHERINAILFGSPNRTVPSTHGRVTIAVTSCLATMVLALVRPSPAQKTIGSSVSSSLMPTKRLSRPHLRRTQINSVVRTPRPDTSRLSPMLRLNKTKRALSKVGGWSDRRGAITSIPHAPMGHLNGSLNEAIGSVSTISCPGVSADKVANALVIADTEDISPLAIIRQTDIMSDTALLESSVNRLGERRRSQSVMRNGTSRIVIDEAPSLLTMPMGDWAVADHYSVDPAHLGEAHSSQCVECNVASGPEQVRINYGPWLRSNAADYHGYSISISQTATVNRHKIVLIDRFGKRHSPDAVAIRPYFTSLSMPEVPIQTTVWVEDKNLPFDELRGLQIEYRQTVTTKVEIGLK